MALTESRRATATREGAAPLATILIVDDDPNLPRFLCRILISKGHRVLDTSNGELALALCRAVHPDLIIADLLMPGMDGYELVRRLRNEEGIAGTRIIFFTGTLHASDAKSLAALCGVQQVLPKPSTPATILHAVDSALSASMAVTHPSAGFDRRSHGERGKQDRRPQDPLPIAPRARH